MYSKRLHPKKVYALQPYCVSTLMPCLPIPCPGKKPSAIPQSIRLSPPRTIGPSLPSPFKLYGERQVNHVKINWQPLKGIQSYKVYRNGQLIGETQGNTYDDYDLKTDQTYTYRVDAYREHQKAASSATQETRTFTYSGETALYDNRNGRHLRTTPDKPSGFKIGKTYFSYRLHRTHKNLNGKEENGWLLSESESKTGLKDSWSKPREIAFYPGVNFEGIGFHYNKRHARSYCPPIMKTKADIPQLKSFWHKSRQKAESKSAPWSAPWGMIPETSPCLSMKTGRLISCPPLI